MGSPQVKIVFQGRPIASSSAIKVYQLSARIKHLLDTHCDRILKCQDACASIGVAVNFKDAYLQLVEYIDCTVMAHCVNLSVRQVEGSVR